MKQYITLLFCFFTVIGFSQEKTVHLVHGLGGDTDSWSNFQSELEKKCNGIKTTTFFNPSNAGLDFYSQGLRKDFQDYGINENDIAIGHSFGGLSLRNVDKEGLFCGYITVGSVHEGSPLADAKLDGSFNNWILNTCKEVFTEPIIAMQRISLFYIAPDLFNGLFEDLICNKVLDVLENKAEAFIGEGQSVRDLIDGGLVASLDKASIPGIGIVCTTDGHPLWNLLDDSDFINLPGNLTFNDAAETIETVAKASSKTLHLLSILTLNPIIKSRLKNASKECKDSYLWMQSTESAWNELIGAGGSVSWTNETVQNWNCGCYNVMTGEPVPCSSLGSDINITIIDIDPNTTCAENEDCWETSTQLVPEYGPDLPSDGLIPLNRQSLPGSIHEDLVENVSHFAEPNDSGVQSRILLHLNPETSIHSKFKIYNCL